MRLFDSLAAQLRRPSFSFLFGSVFLAVTLITSLLFITLGSIALDRFFCYYVDKLHAETHKMLVMQIEMQFDKGRGFNAAYLAELGESAKALGDFFTVRQLDGTTVFSNENQATKCCPDPTHVYTRMEFPIHDQGRLTGYLQAGYFKNHLPANDAEAFHHTAFSLMMIAILAIIVSSAILVFAVLRYLSKPIGQLNTTTKRLARGYWQSRVELKSSVRELQSIAGSVNVLADSLERQEQFRQRLVVELSHELRTPLQILLAEIEAMLDGVHSPSPEHLNSMHSEVERLSGLLKELENRLIYETGTFDISLERVNVSEIVSRIVLGFEASFSQKGLLLEAAITPQLYAMADSVRLAQAVINLLSNAMKYTESGSVSVQLAALNAGVLRLTVEDTGSGIPDEVIEHLAERKRQPFKSLESRGVGLYITSLIAEKHGWDLSFARTVAGGTLVTVDIHIGELDSVASAN